MKTNLPPRVASVECLGGYRLKVSFNDGFIGQVDLGTALTGYYLEPLRQADLFRQVKVSHGTLAWPNDADLCPDVLRYYCELGRVCSREELDAHFQPEPTEAALILNDRA